MTSSGESLEEKKNTKKHFKEKVWSGEKEITDVGERSGHICFIFLFISVTFSKLLCPRSLGAEAVSSRDGYVMGV